MSAMRKVGVYLGLFEDAERDYLDDEMYDVDQDERDTPRQVSSLADHRRRSATGEGSITGVVRPQTAEVGLSRIINLQPRTFNEARVVGENYRDGIPIILNLSAREDVDAKRLVDFAAGLVFSVHGQIERVATKVFLLTPPDVSVGAEAKQRLGEGDFFNQS